MESSVTSVSPNVSLNYTVASPPKMVDQLQPVYVLSIIIYSLTSVLGIPGNGLVVWVTGFKMMKTVNTVWSLNLAVVDFLFTAFLPLRVIHMAMYFHWPFGKFMCQLNNAISALNTFASVFCLTLISVDRCICVVRPVWAQNHRTVRRATWACLAVWATSVILCIPVFIFPHITSTMSRDGSSNCIQNYSDHSANDLYHLRYRALSVTCFVLAFVVPFPIIITCYALIILRLRTRLSKSPKSNRTFKIIAAVLIAFFMCLLPYHVITLLEICDVSFNSELLIADQVTICLAFFNSCLNPLVFCESAL